MLDNRQLQKPVWLTTINPEFVMNACKDPAFFKILTEKTTINVVDGTGLVWAAKVLDVRSQISVVRFFKRLGVGLVYGLEILKGQHREGMVTGVELIDQLSFKAAKTNRSVIYFGGWDDRAAVSAEYFKKKYPGLKVAFAGAEDFDIKISADYMFVARGMKKQELWINENRKKLKVGLVVGVGRSFDYYSGELKRAPERIRRMGLEWLYSLYKEPKRWKRQLALPQFIWKVLTFR